MKYATLLALLAAPAFAQDQGTLSYACQIDGQPAQLTAQYEVIGNSGITTAPNGDISGVISTGSSTVYYQGQLTTPSARYSFTGENAYADFTDLNSHARFRVELVTEGDHLTLIVGPFSDQPLRYFCQRSN
jgi:hypothetical protein